MRPAADGRIMHLRDPRLPQFEFEYHPAAGRVYRLDLPGAWADGVWVPAGAGAVARGHCVAEHVDTPGAAHGATQTFCRGYLVAAAHAAAGTLGTLAPERILKTDPCPVR